MSKKVFMKTEEDVGKDKDLNKIFKKAIKEVR
jgi:hypothetical protein